MINVPFTISIPDRFFWETASILVKRKGSSITAIWCDDRSIVAESLNDAGYVINKAWEKIDTGIVFVRSGIYPVKQTIWLRGDGKGLLGELPAHNPTGGSPPSPFDPSTYVGGVLFVASEPLDYVIRVGDAVTPTETREPLIGNISVHGNAKASVGIRFEFLTNGLVFNIWAMHCTNDGIQISGAGGKPTSSTHFVKLRSVYNGNRGVYVDVNSEHCLIEDVLTVMNRYHGIVLFGSGNVYVKVHSMNDNQGGYSDGTGIKFAEYATSAIYNPKVEGDNAGHPQHGMSVYPNADNVSLTVVSPMIVRCPGTALGLGIANRSNCRICVFGGGIGDCGTGIWVGAANTVEILVKGLNGVNITTPLSIGTPDKVVLDDVIINGVRYSKGIIALSDCDNLPSSGRYVGEAIACYDSVAGKWVLKIWDGSAWQSIG